MGGTHPPGIHFNKQRKELVRPPSMAGRVWFRREEMPFTSFGYPVFPPKAIAMASSIMILLSRPSLVYNLIIQRFYKKILRECHISLEETP
jgi:hypothetical protein